MDEYLKWDDVIDDGQEFTLLEPGEYDFEVIDFERIRSKKDPQLAIAKVVINVTDGYRGQKITEYFALKKSVIFKIASFFRSIGLKKHGENLKMNWEGTIGRKGRCNVKLEPYINKQGEEKKSNKIDEFLDPLDPIEKEINGDDDLPPWMLD